MDLNLLNPQFYVETADLNLWFYIKSMDLNPLNLQIYVKFMGLG